jgi:hypothetical protein
MFEGLMWEGVTENANFQYSKYNCLGPPGGAGSFLWHIATRPLTTHVPHDSVLRRATMPMVWHLHETPLQMKRNARRTS